MRTEMSSLPAADHQFAASLAAASHSMRKSSGSGELAFAAVTSGGRECRSDRASGLPVAIAAVPR
jgi:hypothetical protein